jgi:hypothetical protein
VDQVGLMVYPGLTTATPADYEYDCKANTPSAVANPQTTAGIATYASSPVYKVLGLQSDYKTSDTALLNDASNIVKAAGGVSGCAGIIAKGGVGTFFADAITQAQTLLTSTGRPNVQKAIILLSDGDAGAQSAVDISGKKLTNMPTGTVLGTTSNQCRHAITAAQNAKNAGFWVYSIAYGAASSGCKEDSPNISPCATMQQIASDPAKFFTDTSSKGCPSGANPSSGLVNIFQNIGTDLTSARLLPDDVQ